MLNRTSLMLAAAVVAISAAGAAAAADPYDHNRQDDRGNNNSMQSDSDQSQSAYQNGYSNGYEDGVARHQRNDRYRTDRYRAANAARYERGASYYGDDCRSNNTTGTVIGAIAGGVIGNQFGHGSGRTAATFGGVILGGLAGNAISNDVNCDDRRSAFASYSNGFEGRIGQRYDWRGRDRGNYGSFTPVREYSRGGYTCRDFTSISYHNGREYARSGSACRQNDGNWYMQ